MEKKTAKSKKSAKKTPAEPQLKWVLLDANNQVLGRLASHIASVLMGKNKAIYARHKDNGDGVVVINAAKVRITGRKMETKEYTSFSGYPGGFKSKTLKRAFAEDPTFPLYQAVKGMMPKNSLGYHQLKKLKIYAEAAHPHAAQKPAESAPA